MSLDSNMIGVELHLLSNEKISGITNGEILRMGVSSEVEILEAFLPDKTKTRLAVVPRRSIAFYIPFTEESAAVDLAVQRYESHLEVMR